jgi:hypothetical protein
LAESAKGMAAVTVPDKRQRRRRRAESTAVVKPAKGAARCSKCYIRRKVTLFVVLTYHCLTCLLTCSLTTSSLTTTIAHLLSTHLYFCDQARSLAHLDLARPPFRKRTQLAGGGDGKRGRRGGWEHARLWCGCAGARLPAGLTGARHQSQAHITPTSIVPSSTSIFCCRCKWSSRRERPS